MKGQKKEPWRILVAIPAICYIVSMWVQKNIVTVYETLPKEQLFPVFVTSVGVTLLKIVVITGAVLLINRITAKIRNRKKQ